MRRRCRSRRTRSAPLRHRSSRWPPQRRETPRRFACGSPGRGSPARDPSRTRSDSRGSGRAA
eukprot:6940403-Prymnesium_polylepis.2